MTCQFLALPDFTITKKLVTHLKIKNATLRKLHVIASFNNMIFKKFCLKFHKCNSNGFNFWSINYCFSSLQCITIYSWGHHHDSDCELDINNTHSVAL